MAPAQSITFGDLSVGLAFSDEVQDPPLLPGEAGEERLLLRALPESAQDPVGQSRIEDAMTVVQEGLATKTRDSFFVANLYTVKGEIHEARATLLEATGDAASKAKSSDERHAAIESYAKSNEIDVALQKRMMEDR